MALLRQHMPHLWRQFMVKVQKWVGERQMEQVDSADVGIIRLSQLVSGLHLSCLQPLLKIKSSACSATTTRNENKNEIKIKKIWARETAKLNSIVPSGCLWCLSPSTPVTSLSLSLCVSLPAAGSYQLARPRRRLKILLASLWLLLLLLSLHSSQFLQCPESILIWNTLLIRYINSVN